VAEILAGLLRGPLADDEALALGEGQADAILAALPQHPVIAAARQWADHAYLAAVDRVRPGWDEDDADAVQGLVVMARLLAAVERQKGVS
jgi:hypothetical protein